MCLSQRTDEVTNQSEMVKSYLLHFNGPGSQERKLNGEGAEIWEPYVMS